MPDLSNKTNTHRFSIFNIINKFQPQTTGTPTCICNLPYDLIVIIIDNLLNELYLFTLF